MRKILLLLLAYLSGLPSVFGQTADSYVAIAPQSYYAKGTKYQLRFFCSLQSHIVESQRDRMAEDYGWFLDIVTVNSRTCLQSATVPSVVAYQWLQRAKNFGFSEAEVINIEPVEATPTEDVWVPPGFEALLEPQMTLADVYFGGLKLTSSMVMYTPNDIEFLQLDDIVERLPDLLEPDRVKQSLSGALATNTEFACGLRGRAGCGVLRPTPVVAGVIWDESRFRVDIFLNPNQLAIRSAGVQKYLPDSSGGLSMMQSFYFATGGDELNLDNYSISGVNTLAWRENRLVTDIAVNDDEFDIDEFAFERDYRGLNYRGGYFDGNSPIFSFGYSSNLRGLSIGTSLDTRTDRRQSAGNDIEVFLSTRSQVSIYKDGRLVVSRNYDAGNQVLDTTSLPGGAYDIDIRIVDAYGSETNETRYYIKSTMLPPKDSSEWYFEAGEVTEDVDGQLLAQSTGDWLARAGYARRLTDSIGLGAGLTGHSDEFLGEVSLFNIGSFYQLEAAAAYSDQKGKGASLIGSSSFGRFSLNGNYRRIWNDDDPVNASYDSVLGQSLEQYSVSLSHGSDYGYVSLQARFNSREGQEDLRTYSLRYTAPNFTILGANLFSRFELTKENDDYLALLSFNWRYNNGRWQSTVDPFYRYENIESFGASESEFGIDGSVNWSDQDMFLSDLELTANAYTRDSLSGLSLDYDQTFNMGRLRAQVENTRLNGSSNLSYNLNGSTSFIVAGEGVAVGGQQQTQAAIIVDIEGEAEGVWFDVYVDNRVVGYAVPGARSVITLQPFETYEVYLSPRGNGFADIQGDVRSVTLYPGNAIDLKWSVATVDIIFAKVSTPDGDPLMNAIIEGVAGVAFTDNNGLFQAELKRGTETLVAKTREGSCTIRVPDYVARGGVASLGELVCRH